jgi:putative peptidoglycan lipid II flippase
MTIRLFKSTIVVSGITAISRVLGFMRDMLIAQLFGATPAIDAFYVAFRIPNFMRGLFAEGAFAQAFVPVLSEYHQLRSPEEIRVFIRRMQGMLVLFLSLVTLTALCFTPWLTRLFAFGFIHDPLRFELTTQMLRITFPYLFLISITAFYASVLNTYGHFGAASFTPVLLNLVMILAALFLAPHFSQPVIALAWGVLIAGCLQFLFLMPFLKYKNLLLLPALFWKDPGVRKVGKLLIPALFGVSVAQISLLIDTLFASFLPTGSITWLYYSDRLIYFPLGIFGVALATVILPHLSRSHTDRSMAEFSAALDWALRCVLIIAIPSAIGLYLLAIPLFSALFQYGKFHPHDVEMAALSLRAYAFGLPAFMLVKVLASGFYARQNIRTPVRIAIIALTVNMLLNFALIWHLKHAGLALATALASTANAGLLCWYLITRGEYAVQKGWGKYITQLGLAGAAIAAFLFFFSPDADTWLHWPGQTRITHLLFLLLSTVALYFACLYLTGLRLRHFFLARPQQ